jgi:hypothetical protein
MSATASRSRRPLRHAEPPRTVRAWLGRERFTLARRATQLLVLLAFAATLHLGWTIAGQPVLAGNLSASKLAGMVPMPAPPPRRRRRRHPLRRRAPHHLRRRRRRASVPWTT